MRARVTEGIRWCEMGRRCPILGIRVGRGPMKKPKKKIAFLRRTWQIDPSTRDVASAK